jgi:glycosyltransferase involved in cell wall biosynthesis
MDIGLMKIVIINTAEIKGGAAVACNRLHEALVKAGFDSTMLVRQKSSQDPTVFEFSESKLRKKINLFFFFFELFILKFFKKKKFDFSLPFFGPALHKHPLVKNADIIHIHWVQNSFLTLSSLKKLQTLNKPIVWTLHDMWAFTGGCHYNVECRKFESACNVCPQLKNSSIIDFSKIIFNKKREIIKKDIQIVTPSNWLALEASNSTLLKANPIEVIPYNINLDLFKPLDKEIARKQFNIGLDKKIILFVSMSLEDDRKGFEWFKESIKKLENSIPNWTDRYEILAIGRHSNVNHFKTRIHYTGRLQDINLISKAYAAADVFVAPSIQDNLPNTVIESLACGTPIVAFNIGGMPDMIVHKHNGYLATLRNTDELANGILFCTSNDLSNNARDYALEKYQSSLIVKSYVDLYKVRLNEIT